MLPSIAVTFDLGRVTTHGLMMSYQHHIAVTFDLGRVTTYHRGPFDAAIYIAVTFDLGRVTT